MDPQSRWERNYLSQLIEHFRLASFFMLRGLVSALPPGGSAENCRQDFDRTRTIRAKGSFTDSLISGPTTGVNSCSFF